MFSNFNFFRKNTMKNMLWAVALVAWINVPLASAQEQITIIDLQPIPFTCSLYTDKTSTAIMACLDQSQLFQEVEVLWTATIVSTWVWSKIAYDNVISFLKQDPSWAKDSWLKQTTEWTVVWDIDWNWIKDITFTEEQTTAHDFAYWTLDTWLLNSLVTTDEFTWVIYDQTGENIPKEGLEGYECATIPSTSTIQAKSTEEITISARKWKVCTLKTNES